MMGRRTFEAGRNRRARRPSSTFEQLRPRLRHRSHGRGVLAGAKYGVQPQVLYDVLTEGLFAAPAYKVYGKIIVDEAYGRLASRRCWG